MADKLTKMVSNAVRVVLADQYAVGDDEGVTAIAQAAIRAASLSDMQQWTQNELEQLLNKLTRSRCSAVGHEGHLENIGATAVAKAGAKEVSETLLEAAVIIGTLYHALGDDECE